MTHGIAQRARALRLHPQVLGGGAGRVGGTSERGQMDLEVTAQRIALIELLEVLADSDLWLRLRTSLEDYLQALDSALSSDRTTSRQLGEILYPKARSLMWAIQRSERDPSNMDLSTLVGLRDYGDTSGLRQLETACEKVIAGIMDLDAAPDSVVGLVRQALPSRGP